MYHFTTILMLSRSLYMLFKKEKKKISDVIFLCRVFPLQLGLKYRHSLSVPCVGPRSLVNSASWDHSHSLYWESGGGYKGELYK